MNRYMRTPRVTMETKTEHSQRPRFLVTTLPGSIHSPHLYHDRLALPVPEPHIRGITRHVLLWEASFAQLHSSAIHACFGFFWSFLVSIIPLYEYIRFVHLVSYGWTSGLFPAISY